MGRRNLDKICFSKKQYQTQEEVEEVIRHLYETENLMLNFYLCPICAKFHLTSKTK